ncbi:MAG: ACT domain-containing protein [Firmicutes bacterium]|nr:ACT domain-containing protein [Bacillota bacterium]
MGNKDSRFFLVAEDILPESIVKTVRARELLLKGEAATVGEAVEKVSLSRSAFYKYKDKVFPFYRWPSGMAVTLFLVLEHRSGVLSKVIGTLAGVGANILTINQIIPIHGLASVTVTFETSGVESSLEDIVALAGELDGVRVVKPVGLNP